ncbi:MAG: M28 family peptidase [Clostridia bacterium]|nr:M28 family peptidase [Clostridia bacterium]
MTETTRVVFDKYQVRKTKKQKSAFIEYVEGIARAEGYAFNVEKGTFGAKNIVIGDPKSARVVYTAHYDTCPVLPLPNFITPKNVFIYILYQLLLTAVILLPIVAVSFLSGWVLGTLSAFVEIPDDVVFALLMIIGYFMLFLVMFLLLAGPANKHTANDNTSGVTTLLDIMTTLPYDLREGVAFVFFDLEEVGLVGSSSFAAAHREEMKDKLLLNFDCVSDGENFIFALKKGAKKHKELLERAFASEAYSVEVLSKGVFYPSDQMNFPEGVGVASLKRTKKLGILYMDRIHTPKDTVYEEGNIAFLTEGACALASMIINPRI